MSNENERDASTSTSARKGKSLILVLVLALVLMLASRPFSRALTKAFQQSFSMDLFLKFKTLSTEDAMKLFVLVLHEICVLIYAIRSVLIIVTFTVHTNFNIAYYKIMISLEPLPFTNR